MKKSNKTQNVQLQLINLLVIYQVTSSTIEPCWLSTEDQQICKQKASSLTSCNHDGSNSPPYCQTWVIQLYSPGGNYMYSI